MIAGIITGAILIITGFLVKRFPMLIAGYNTMPKAEREKIDTNSVSTLMRNVLCVMGVLITIAAILIEYTGRRGDIELIIPAIIFGGVAFLFIAGRKNHNRTIAKTKKSKWGVGIAIATSIIVFGLIGYNAILAKISISDEELIISGGYGLTIPLEDITAVELKEKLPSIQIKTNGLGMGSIKKGHFRLDEYGSVRLYFQRNLPPYIIIKTASYGIIIIDRKTKEEAITLYKALPQRWEVDFIFD